ncbi:hypothetical protein H5410_046722, partial [Solanum commersonii]
FHFFIQSSSKWNWSIQCCNHFFPNGGGQNFEEIQVGWIVHPSLNGDNRTHMYTKWTVDGHQKTECYNTKCPRFIQLSRVNPIDYSFPRTSEIERNYKKEVLQALSLYTPGSQDVKPAMGNGQFRGGYWQLTCYMHKVLYEIEVDGQKK